MSTLVRFVAGSFAALFAAMAVKAHRGGLGRFGRQGVHADAAAQPGPALDQAEPARGQRHAAS